PDITILAVQTRDIAPDLWERYADLSMGEVRAEVERASESFRSYVRAFRAHSDAHLIVHNLEEPQTPSMGVLDSHKDAGQVAAIRRINTGLYSLSKEFPGVYVLDYDAVIAQQGRRLWHDERKWAAMRLPVASDKLIYLVKEWLRYIHPLSGRVCKVLVTDLDNTIWRGVIGEDGIEGIRCGPQYPGSTCRALQRAMLDLYRRGILLAVCSKNNEADALEALEKHQDVLLRPRYFSAMRINWLDKVQNLREIAGELNIGIDSFAYIDDDPVELDRVRTALPEIYTIESPQGEGGIADALLANPVFERLAVSEEDKQRQRYYSEQREREEFKQGTVSLEDFYRSLEQVVEIGQVAQETTERAAQLTQKTNQFNLTTRRYSEQQIINMAASPEWRVFTARVSDRFGDNGVVGVVITHEVGGICEVDTLLLSCRVIGRTIETALLYFLVERARSMGMKRLQGRFLPTKKNSVAKDFYARHGFLPLEEEGERALWAVEPSAARIACPEWIRLIVSEGASS
ncbi:MAG TPA: HAD-IIIC family phosphatase, partial [Blastocatellia bacterium]|nr:HAD-IIIC family phosphatase [Blastocatellia bacterium]